MLLYDTRKLIEKTCLNKNLISHFKKTGLLKYTRINSKDYYTAENVKKFIDEISKYDEIQTN